ncbi:hypothetical protein ACK367_11800, partial [Aeromonas veronii]
GVKRRAHDADLKWMLVIRSPSFQLVTFKLHQFGQQRRFQHQCTVGRVRSASCGACPAGVGLA